MKEQAVDQGLEERLRQKADIRLRGQSDSSRGEAVAAALLLLDGCKSRFDRHKNCDGYDQKIAASAAVSADPKIAAVHRMFFFDRTARVAPAARIREAIRIAVHIVVRTCYDVDECDD